MTTKQAIRLGGLIRAAREAKGLTLRDLEERTGVTRTWLVYLEAGRSLEPLADRVAKLSEVLDIDAAKIDRVSGNYLAQSLPTVRTYFRSKDHATEDELDELERVIADVQAKYRDRADDGKRRAQPPSRGVRI